MLKHLLISLFVLVGPMLKAQVNLVPNGSFEDIANCPQTYEQIFTATGWFQPTKGSSDLYNSCNTQQGSDGVPDNWAGFQYPQDGEGYAGFLCYGFYYVNGIRHDSRENIAVKLKEPLKPNHDYCYSMYINLAENGSFIISSIGAYFSTDSIYIDTGDPLPFEPQIENAQGNFIDDTTAWQQVRGSFTATGAERYLYIGNFRDSSHTVMLNLPTSEETYLYVDNVELYECDATSLTETQAPAITIYPNPATNTVSISLPQNYLNPQLYIYNLTGQLVVTKPVQPNLPVPITELNAGMYIFAIQSNNTLIGRQRVVVY